MSDEDNETPWKPLDGHTVRKEEQVGEPGFGFLIRWAHAEPDDQGVLWVDFAIYEQCGLKDVTWGPGGKTTGSTVVYPIPNWRGSGDDTSDVGAAAPLISGFVKWDGCTQWHQNHGGHFDHRDEFERFADVMKRARMGAAELMPATDIAQEYNL